MRFVSTRGEAPPIGFEEILLSGPALDGGLYVPENWPLWTTAQFSNLAGRPYSEIVGATLASFIDDPLWQGISASAAREVYSRFAHPEIAPLVPLGGGRYLLELFHGPTFAFKDFALQLLAPLMDEALKRRGNTALVLAATSGDTGAAAIHALAGRPNIKVVVLHPKGRISDIQRRQMTTVTASNIRNIAIEGNFDDAQALVKVLFADRAFAVRHKLAAINSINWVRIAAQAAYYISTCLRLGMKPLTFAVPTGNFGDVFAGFLAKQMGAPITRLIVATNQNDILARAIETGIYERGAVHATLSPAMDIQVASNFERLIFEAHGRDAATTRHLMVGFAKTGSLAFSPTALASVRKLFSAISIGEDETLATIADVFKTTGRVVDPHTAVGIAAAQRLTHPDETVVMLATAHPAKFGDAVERATGRTVELPEALRAVANAPERYETLPNDAAALKARITAM